MPDIYNRAADNYGGSFSADAARVTFAQAGILGESVALGGAGVAIRGVGMLVQNLTFTYQQAVTRIYEIGSNFSFYVAGRTQGSANMGRVLGPRPLMPFFYKKYGDVCNAASNILDLELATGCSTIGSFATTAGQKYRFSVKYCVITSIGVSMTAQEMLVNEQLQMLFCSLSMNGVNQ